MIKEVWCSMNNRFDSDTNKEKEIIQESSGSSIPITRGSSKSLPTLTARDSLERLQKVRRRSSGGGNSSRRSLFGKSCDRRVKKKHQQQHRKRLDKPNVSEVNICKVADDGCDELISLVSLISPRTLVEVTEKPKANVEVSAKSSKSQQIDDSTVKGSIGKSKKIGNEGEPCEILLEKLQLSSEEANDNDEAKIDELNFGSGDANNLGDLTLDLELLSDEDDDFTDMACARAILNSKRRGGRVQWNHEVDVIYYAGGKMLRRENEPLREESEQQASHSRFIQLALAKNLLSSVTAYQLRDPWLVPLSK